MAQPVSNKKVKKVISNVVALLPKPTTTEVTPMNSEKFSTLSEREQTILCMLKYKRPAGSDVEQKWIDTYIKAPIAESKYTLEQDDYGNMWVEIPHVDGTTSTTLFSAHTDTVHHTSGFQAIEYDSELMMLYLADEEKGKASTSKKKTKMVVYDMGGKRIECCGSGCGKACKQNTPEWKAALKSGKSVTSFDSYGTSTYVGRTSNCLGADDGSGVFIMMEMIEAGIPGTYVFHREEEIGGLGSSYIVASQADELKKSTGKYAKGAKAKKKARKAQVVHPIDLTKFDRAIAFDRMDVTDIITSQIGGCASKEFAADLGSHLNDLMDIKNPLNKWKGCPGVFTDTANYTDHIAECTNLSVGYYSQHTTNEKQDVKFLFELADACLKVQWDGLTTSRKPGDSYDPYWDNYDQYPYTSRYGTQYGGSTYTQPKDKDRVDYTSVGMGTSEAYEWIPKHGFKTYEEAETFVYDQFEAASAIIWDMFSEQAMEGVGGADDDEEATCSDYLSPQYGYTPTQWEELDQESRDYLIKLNEHDDYVPF